MISGMAGIEPMEFIIEHSTTYAVLSLVGAVMITVVEYFLKDHKGSGDMGEIQTDATGGIDRVNILFAIAPMLPLVLLLLGNTYVPAIKMGVAC